MQAAHAGPLCRLICLLPALVLAAFAEAAALDSGSPDALVRQLGSKSFSERAAASKALEELGEAALPALQKAADSADAEVRRQAALLVETIENRLADRARAMIKALVGRGRAEESLAEGGDRSLTAAAASSPQGPRRSHHPDEIPQGKLPILPGTIGASIFRCKPWEGEPCRRDCRAISAAQIAISALTE
jgi:hypothetical protein